MTRNEEAKMWDVPVEMLDETLREIGLLYDDEIQDVVVYWR